MASSGAPERAVLGQRGGDFLAILATQALLTAGLVLFAGVLDLGVARETNNWVLASFAPASAITIGAIMFEVRRRPYSLHLIHLIALLVLLEFVPLLQYVRGRFPHALQFPMGEDDVVMANMAVLLWVISYLAAVYVGTRIDVRRLGFLGPLLGLKTDAKRLRLGFALAMLACAYLAARGVGGSFTRRAFGDNFGASNSLDLLFGSVFVRSMPLMLTAALIHMLVQQPSSRRWVNYLLVGTLVPAVLWFVNPLAAARYWTGSIVIAFGVLIYAHRRKTGAFVLLAMVVGVTMLPLLEPGRSSADASVFASGHTAPTTTDYLSSAADFDGYVNLAMTRDYVERRGHTGGHQILGVAFFFVPRSIWPNKPIGSGSMVSARYGFPNHNVATPLPGEGMVNFGWPGVVFMACLFGLGLGVVDATYWRRLETELEAQSIRVIDVVYAFWLGLIFFMTRGDLLSGFAFIVGATAAGVIVLMPIPYFVQRAERPSVAEHR